MSLLSVEDVKCYFPIEKGLFKTNKSIKALDGINLNIMEGETYGLVGESGSGKSTLARVIAGLQTVTSGEIHYNNEEITPKTNYPKALKIRDIQMIFQDPYSSIDPRMTIRKIIEEPMYIQKISKDKRRKRVSELLDLVGLPMQIAERYPHELSGGQRQRVVIARTISLNPKIIICDESVSALDVSVQAQILNLLDSLQKEFNLTYLFIAHDLGVVRHMSDRVGIMYLGEIVEQGDTAVIYQNPLHPYTQGLISAIPSVDKKKKERIEIRGEIPSPIDLPTGCRFHTRCPFKMELCEQIAPSLKKVEDGRFVSCHIYQSEKSEYNPLQAIVK